MVVGLLPNKNKETADENFEIHRALFKMCSQLALHVISFGADDALTEYNTQRKKINILIKFSGFFRKKNLLFFIYGIFEFWVFFIFSLDGIYLNLGIIF